MTAYKAERRVFNRLKSDISDQAQQEYETAIKTLLERYNTTVLENRFIVGGAVEVFTYALLLSVGIDCHLYGAQATDGDIILPDKKLLSIKGSFTGGFDNVKLINKQGGGHREWKTATLFVISEVGIIFGTPDMVSKDDIVDVSDGTMIKKKALQSIANDGKNVIALDVARKPPTEMAGSALKASAAVAHEILSEMDLKNLLANLERHY